MKVLHWTRLSSLPRQHPTISFQMLPPRVAQAKLRESGYVRGLGYTAHVDVMHRTGSDDSLRVFWGIVYECPHCKSSASLLFPRAKINDSKEPVYSSLHCCEVVFVRAFRAIPRGQHNGSVYTGTGLNASCVCSHTGNLIP